MLRKITCAVLGLSLLGSNSNAQQRSCSVVQEITTRNGEFVGRVFQNSQGLIWFRDNVDVNTDGALESYGVSDLGYYQEVSARMKSGRVTKARLNTRAALNTICNGVNIRRFIAGVVDVSKHPVVYSAGQCRSLITAFEDIRSRDWAIGPDNLYVDFYAISRAGALPGPAGRNRYKPCERDGYYVSQTSKPMNSATVPCDPDYWIDALKISAIVVPLTPRLTTLGVREFDIAAVRRAGTLDWHFAIIGDTNQYKMGEGTVLLAQRLANKPTVRPANYRETIGLALSQPHEYVIFPGSRSQLNERNNRMDPAIQSVGRTLAQSYALPTVSPVCTSP